MMRLTITMAILMTTLALPAGATMFKWTDANGKTQYGQFPPAGVEATRIKSAPDPKSAPARKPLDQQMKELDQQLEARETAEAEAAAKKQNAEIRKQNCANARKNITQLGYGGNRLAQMPDGSYKRLDEAEKQKMIKKNEDAIKEFCD
ncbi:MAG: DUF4124 domain-containing protein [Thiogranum sp.]